MIFFKKKKRVGKAQIDFFILLPPWDSNSGGQPNKRYRILTHDINKCDNFYISVFKDFNIPEDLFGELFAEGINNQVYTQPKTIRKTLMHSHSS